VVLPLSRSLSPSSRFSLRRRLGSAESMCITRRSYVRVKVRSTRSHMTLERRRAPPIDPGSEEAARTRPRGASPTWHRRPSGIATAHRWAPGGRVAYRQSRAARTGLSTPARFPARAVS
jgi:hypothetical protein